MAAPELSYALVAKTLVLRFAGDVRQTEFASLDTAANLHALIERSMSAGTVDHIVVDAAEVVGMDSTHLGLLARLAVLSADRLGKRPVLYAPTEKPRRLLHAMGMDTLFDLCAEAWTGGVATGALPQGGTGAKDAVLTAHRALSALNSENADQFKALIQLLESEPD